MNRFVIALAGVLGTAGLASAGASDLFNEKTKDFGVTPRGPVLVHYFRVTNTTNNTITIGQPRVSCGCVSASVVKNQLAPGESSAIVAHMDTRRINTPYQVKMVTVYVPFLSPVHEEVSLRVQTVTRDDLMMSPDTIAFGTVNKGKGATATTKVTFMSDPNWSITEATSTGGFVKASFKEESRNGSMVTYAVTATLDPACPVGNWVSDINLKTSNAGVAALRIPVTVNVTTPMAVSPEAVSFGDVALGKAAEQKITLASGTPFKVLEVKSGDDVVVTLDTKDAKASHTLTFAATPKAAGGFARKVEIVTDNKDMPNVVIPVSAKVIGK
jgi:Protein of unknown function (DUF1573)